MTPEEHLAQMERANKDDLFVVCVVISGVGLILLLAFIALT
jgi:hypothetical protein